MNSTSVTFPTLDGRNTTSDKLALLALIIGVPGVIATIFSAIMSYMSWLEFRAISELFPIWHSMEYSSFFKEDEKE
jgi:hypothetical protein